MTHGTIGAVSVEHPTPHDAFFKQMFTRPELARDLVDLYLPPRLRRVVDPARVDVVSGSFVDRALRAGFSDVLYRVRGARGGAWIYVLLEHKSRAERYVALQLLRLMTQIWQRCREHRVPLAPVLPVVVHAGPRPWSGPRRFTELFDLPRPLVRHTPDFEFVLIDPGAMSDRRLRRSPPIGASLLALAAVHRRDLVQQLTRTLRMANVAGTDVPERVITYWSAALGSAREKGLVQAVRAAAGGSLVPTIAEKWMSTASQKTARKHVVAVLEARFGQVPDEIRAAIETETDLARLERLTSTAATIPSLQEFAAVLAR